MQGRAVATVLLGSVLVTALQKGSLIRLAVGHTKADLVIVFIACCGMVWGVRGGLLGGAAGGVLQGLAQGMNVGSVIASRLLTGYLVGRLAVVVSAEQILMAAPVALAATVVCEVVYYLFSPWLAFGPWVRVVAGEAALNAGLAVGVQWAVLRAGTRARKA